MGPKFKAIAAYALIFNAVIASVIPNNVRGAEYHAKRADNLTIDLDYALYQGYTNTTSGLNIWKGIRYAAPPTGNLRWKAPHTPDPNRNVTSAAEFGPICPQAYPAVPNAPFIPGNEDCLFLNVYAPLRQTNPSPPNTTTGPDPADKLPVFVWIHGGGYGFGDSSQDMTEIISGNGKSFIAVTIQYRLGAFGFLSSSEVKASGVPNAGLLDIAFALDWVQKHISKFGGDNKKVTIAGESAGGGAVTLLGIAKGGSLGTSLFLNGIAASPYIPAQYDYNATRPTKLYYDLASAVSCGSSGAVLDCLRSVDSMTLQRANFNITTSGTYGTWSYLPVTDYSFISSLPSVALNSKKVNGQSILVGNNANEGPLFVPPTISTLDDLKAWLALEFPTFTSADIQKVLDAYPSSDAPVNASDSKFATNGVSGPTAVNVSQVATGQQQRANNIYAEATFVCPSYWLSTAYSAKTSFHYQYSIPFASHTEDMPGYFGPATPNQPSVFSSVFRKIFGNFIINSSPAIPDDQATARWPAWVGGAESRMVNLNTTGGVPYEAVTQFGATVTQFMDPGVKNAFSTANAHTWEGGRGARCDFWKTMGSKVPM